MKHTIMIDERSIAERVASLAEQICNDYKGKQIALVAVSNGAFIFAADLFRKLPHDTYFDSVKASSYKAAKRGELVLKETFNIDLNGKHVLLVDDILDSGVTLSNIAKYLESLGVAPHLRDARQARRTRLRIPCGLYRLLHSEQIRLRLRHG